jgi:hypothetical protein
LELSVSQVSDYRRSTARGKHVPAGTGSTIGDVPAG